MALSLVALPRLLDLLRLAAQTSLKFVPLVAVTCCRAGQRTRAGAVIEAGRGGRAREGGEPCERCRGDIDPQFPAMLP